MATFSVSEVSSFLNHQINIQERIEASLWRLEALMAVTMTENFYDLSSKVLHNYFSLVGDLIEGITKENKTCLDELCRQERVINS